MRQFEITLQKPENQTVIGTTAHRNSLGSQEKQFYFFLSHLDAFDFFFSYLIYLAKIFSTMLKRSGKSRHLCLVPDLRGKAFSFLSLSMMLPVDIYKTL